MAETENKNVVKENLEILSQPENFQKYILGTKKNGAPRAVYDVIKDYTQPKKKKKKHKKKHKNDGNSYSWYMDYGSGKKNKKKKKKNKSKYWHI